MRLIILLLLVCGETRAQHPFSIRTSPGSLLELTVEKTGLLSGKKHLLVFDDFSGELDWKAVRPEESTVHLSIASSSVRCLDTWVNAKDLRKIREFAVKDMLAAGTYPRIDFHSQSVTLLEPGRFEVKGTLTIRGVSKPVSVIVGMEKAGTPQPVFSGAARLRLTEFGLKPPSAALGTC